MKTCKKCLETKTLDHFSRMTKTGAPRAKCKACYCLEQKERRAKTPDLYRGLNRRWRLENREKSEEGIRRWRAAHKKTCDTYRKQWAEKNPEKDQVAKDQSRYRARDAGKIRARHVRYAALNADKIKVRNEKYRLANMWRYTATSARRRAAKQRATPRWADNAKIAMLYAEAERLTRETGIPHEVDHIVPLQGRRVCGLHWEGNLRVITKAENRKKSNLCELTKAVAC